MALRTETDPSGGRRPARRHENARQIAAVQRGRLIAAAVSAVEEEGIAALTVSGIVARARVARKTFYDIFSDSEDCMLAAVDDALQRAHSEATTAYESAPDWRSGMRAATHTILSLIDQERALARICIVDAPAAGERVIERREHYMRRFATAIDIGREHSSSRAQPQPLTALAMAGGILTVLQSHLLEDDERPAGELAGSLMALIVLPYLGRAAAGREYLDTPPTRRLGTRRRRADADHAVLAGLKLRMTYRTIRVLSAIREHPGASNRDVAEAAGITDPGQISKLLKRLEGLELAENRGDGQSKGAANAWHLTALGRKVQQLAKLS